MEVSGVQGTGRHGAITREDIERTALANKQVPKTPVSTPSVSPPNTPAVAGQQRMRQAIAAAMAKSKREIPHYYLSTTIDMQPAMNWLAEENSRRPITDRLIFEHYVKGGVLCTTRVARIQRAGTEPRPLSAPIFMWASQSLFVKEG